MVDENQLWIMVDVETSGPSYERHSLLEIGAAVGSLASREVDSFAALLTPTTDHVDASRSTYEEAKSKGEDPVVVMSRFAAWAEVHVERGAKFVARPAAFDWPWIVHYSWSHLGNNPFGFKAVCASSWFEALGKRFSVKLPHVAVQDARIQLAHFLEHGFAPV